MESTESPVWPLTVIDYALQPKNQEPLSVFDSHVRLTGRCGDSLEFSTA